MKKSNSIIVFVIAVVLIIAIIVALSGDQSTLGEEEKTCIANKSTLYVSKTCGHCANQKLILGDDIEKFNVIDCTTNMQECVDNEIRVVPTWIINKEVHEGVHSWEELKEVANC